MTNEKFNRLEHTFQIVINILIAIALFGILSNISNTNKSLNKINEKVGADIHCKTNFVGFAKMYMNDEK